MVFLCVFIFEWVDLVKIYPEDKNFQIVIEVSFNINGSSKGITFSVYPFYARCCEIFGKISALGVQKSSKILKNSDHTIL